MKRNNNHNGFTLIELIIVIALLGVITGIGVPLYKNHVAKASEKVCVANRDELMYSYDIIKIGQDNEDFSLSDFLLDSEDLVDIDMSKVCPSGGIISVSEDGKNLVCSFHDKINTNPEPEIPGGNPSSVENYTYESVPYNNNNEYKYGDIVEKDGVIYRCIKNADENIGPNDYTVGEFGYWEAISTSDSSSAPYDYRVMYAAGTIVNHNGKTWMFTPVDNNTNIRNNEYATDDLPERPSYQNSEWTEITDGSNIVKPTYLDYSDLGNIKVRPSNSNMLEDNQYYYNTDGNVYQYHSGHTISGWTSDYTALDYYGIKCGSWTAITSSNIYYYQNVQYKPGDIVWYKGHNYKAKVQFIPDGKIKYRPNNNSYYWELVE